MSRINGALLTGFYACGTLLSSPYILEKNFSAMQTKNFPDYEGVYIGTILLATWSISLPLTFVGTLPDYLRKIY